MKKHKSVVAILLAVMMIFTMMPMMAFAAIDGEGTGSTTYQFSDDLSQIIVKATGKYYVGTVKTWDASTGLTTVAWNPNENGDLTDPQLTFSYYDLTGSTFTVGGKDLAASYNGLTTSKIDGLKLVKPADATSASATTTKVVLLSKIKTDVGAAWDYAIKLNGDTAAINQKDEEQPVEVTLEQTWTAANNHKVVGSPAAATTKVTAKGAAASDAAFYFDAYSKDASALTVSPAVNTINYDGEEHTIVMKDLKGYEVSYSTFNKKTGATDAVEKVVLKDVLDEDLEVHAKVVDSATKKTDTQEFVFKVNVDPAGKPTFAAVKEDNDHTYTVYDNEEYDVYSYVEIQAKEVSDLVKTAANKKATAANEALLMDFFKEYYGVTGTPGKVKEDTVTLKCGDYALAKATKLADADAKYTAMLKDFGFTDASLKNGFNTVTFSNAIKVLPANQDYEVEFTSAPSKKTYHVKKASKTKKTYSFKVKAVASNGAAVTYKLINANSKIKINKTTGKITIKKGLKKGTYNIKVKAYVPAKNQMGYAQETQAIKIVIKK